MDYKEFDLIVTDIEVNKPNFVGQQNWSFDADGSDEYGHINMVLSGKEELTINNQKYTALPNQFTFVPRSTPYFCKVSGTFKYYSFYFKYTSNIPGNKFAFPTVLAVSNPDWYLKLYKQAYNLYLTKQPGYKFQIKKIFYEILNALTEECFAKDTIPEIYKIKASVDYLYKNFSNADINIPEIAAISDITDTYFRKLFKAAYNTSPAKLVNNLRINKAKQLLITSNISIEDISKKCGFNDYFYFARIFSKTTGMTPTKYRQIYNKEFI